MGEDEISTVQGHTTELPKSLTVVCTDLSEKRSFGLGLEQTAQETMESSLRTGWTCSVSKNILCHYQ